MPAKFTFLIDGDNCSADTFKAILQLCAEDILGCNRIIVFRGEKPFPLDLPDTTKAYRDLLEKMFFSDIPDELHNNPVSFVAYAIGHASAHKGNMKDHIADIFSQSVPFLASRAAKKQHYVFVTTVVHQKQLPRGTFRIRKPDDLTQLADNPVNRAGGGGSGVEAVWSMVPSQFASMFQKS